MERNFSIRYTKRIVLFPFYIFTIAEKQDNTFATAQP